MVEADRSRAVNIAARPETTTPSFWKENGWLLVPRFLGATELDILRNEADRLWADQGLFGSRGAIPNSASTSLTVSTSFAPSRISL